MSQLRLAAYFPDLDATQQQAMADCMMAAYNVNGDDVITRDEFDAGFGQHYPGCYDSVSLVATKHTAKTAQEARSLKEAISVGKKSTPDPEDVWAHFSGDDDEVTAQELHDGLATWLLTNSHSPFK